MKFIKDILNSFSLTQLMIPVFIFYVMIYGVCCSDKPETKPLPTTQCWECTYQGLPMPPPFINVKDSCGPTQDLQSWVITMQRNNYDCKEIINKP